MISKIQGSIFLGLLFFLTACGGGGDSEESNTPDPGAGEDPPAHVEPPSSGKASRFLQQTTFGATPSSIQRVVDLGYEDWIDWQMSLSTSRHTAYYNRFNYNPDDTWSLYVDAWWHRSLKAEDQLRQRVAFALSEIWVISQYGVSSGGVEGNRSLSNYYDILLEHSFGNYRDLMQDVTLSPVMGEYLSMLRNRKPDLERNIRPDENYARELMQLFTVGLVELNLDGSPKLDSQGNTIPTYDQEDIEGLAHVFTGWTWQNAETFWWWSESRDLESPMKAFPEFHAEGEKRIINGGVIPAGQTPEQDLQQALDHIFNHPNVGPFVSKQLIQKLVTSNPSPDYVERVATVFNDNGDGVRGDMAAVVKAILLDDEAVTGVASHDKPFGKLKEPILKLSAFWRAFNANTGSGTFEFRWVDSDFGQGPLKSPSVFNFFSPNYQPAGTLKDADITAPEFEIHTEGTMAKMTNHLHWRSLSMNNFERTSPDAKDIIVNYNRERDLASSSHEELIEHLNILLLAGSMSDRMKTVLTDYLATISDDDYERKAIEAVSLVITSPEFAVQR
ncbi:DUF1800 domain-containing protein [Kangiella taiwanensis]|uniref:DUF1800 domain-containing protein n=1 Tax=Kangiella taiwanensis TaxID=1079179 RepID=A0ABP8I597_9GAMM|nr:DUF1800 domain-containing protein [Kangiella taiwanensis]